MGYFKGTAFAGGQIIEEVDGYILGKALIVSYKGKFRFEDTGGIYTEEYIKNNLGEQFNIEYYSNILEKMKSYRRELKLEELFG